MSSPSSNAADVGILARNQGSSDDASMSKEPEFTRRFDVYECIEYGVDHCGSCCDADIADGSTTSPALPPIVNLRISGVGNIPLPISDHHGEEIKKRAINKEEPSNGVYEIGADKIKIQNPQWDESFKSLVETVAFKLGVNPSHLSAELDSLIYMEKGGYIERCRGDEDVMGYLFIQLPSKFTGGGMTVYNTVEDDNGDEEEESFHLTLGGVEATYSCHFACHFSDCEYEMAKLHSGSRVLLRYALLHEKIKWMATPTASLIQGTTSPFERSLNGLPPADRMVLIPLEEEYGAISLVNSGIKGLSREHRQKAEALKAAGAGAEWELLIVNAKLVHYCSRYGDHNNTASIVEIFDENGNCVTDELNWLKKAIDFNSIEHDEGMLLAFDDDYECVSNWGACKYSSGEYSTKQTYKSTFLLSYDPAVGMELKCLGGSEEVAEVCQEIVETRDFDLLDRLLSVVGTKKKSKFDVKSCQLLLRMLIKSRKSITSRVALVNKIISGLSSSIEPDELLYDTILDAVDRLGHDDDELGSSIEELLNDADRKGGKDICFFMKRMKFALKLNKRIEGEAGLNYLETAINDLSLSTRTPLNSAAAVTSIMDMISTYNEMDLSNVVQACLANFHRGGSSQSHVTLMDRAHLLQQLLATKKFGSLESSLLEFAADFGQSAQSLASYTSENILKGENKSMLVQATAFLIEFGTQDGWDKFGKHIIKTLNLFSAFTDAVMSENRLELLRDVLNKCLLQHSITGYTLIRCWTVRKSGEPNIDPTPSLHVQKVLELYPSIVQTVDKDKRLPLHYAAEYPSASFDVTMEVFKAYKHAASIRDPVTGLFPFQLAASNVNIEASFSLLLENPNLVSSGIKSGDRKRKRSSSE